MQVELNVKTRGEIGSPEARRQRIQGEMPGIVYGLGMEPISILVDSSDFKTSLKTEAGSNVIINLSAINLFIILKQNRVEMLR